MLKVSCAIIESDGKILAAQRGENMRNAGKWEFPGGKIEEGESAEACIIREIKEELMIDIEVLAQEEAVNYVYPDFKICLIPFRCKQIGGNITLNEHQSISWKSPHKLEDLDWSSADILVMKQYVKKYYS